MGKKKTELCSSRDEKKEAILHAKKQMESGKNVSRPQTITRLNKWVYHSR